MKNIEKTASIELMNLVEIFCKLGFGQTQDLAIIDLNLRRVVIWGRTYDEMIANHKAYILKYSHILEEAFFD